VFLLQQHIQCGLVALGTVTFYHDGHINFSLEDKHSRKALATHDLFLERFNPVVAADFGNGEQLFILDIGSTVTVLSAAFYQEDKRIIDVAGAVTLGLSGVGGSQAHPAYRIPSLIVMFAKSCAKVRDLSLLTGPTGDPDEFYGTVGETALNSFPSFTLDFRRMHFSVNGGKPGHCSDSSTLASTLLTKKSGCS